MILMKYKHVDLKDTHFRVFLDTMYSKISIDIF